MCDACDDVTRVFKSGEQRLTGARTRGRNVSPGPSTDDCPLPQLLAAAVNVTRLRLSRSSHDLKEQEYN